MSIWGKLDYNLVYESYHIALCSFFVHLGRFIFFELLLNFLFFLAEFLGTEMSYLKIF